MLMAVVGEVKQAQVTMRGNGLYDVEYLPDAEGPCKIDVTYAGHPVPNRCVLPACLCDDENDDDDDNKYLSGCTKSPLLLAHTEIYANRL